MFEPETFTRDEAIKMVRDAADYGDMSAKDLLEEFQEIVKVRPSKVSEAEFKGIIATYAPDAPRTKVVCKAETPDNRHICTQEKGHSSWHKDADGYKWKDGEVAASRASRVPAIRPDGTCKNGHQLQINGQPTKDCGLSKKGEIKCKACNRDYQKRFRSKSQQPVGIVDEAFRKLGLESFEAAWFGFKTKFKRLDAIQVLGKLLELPMLDPEVYDYLVQASQAPTVPVETPSTLQEEPKQPDKYVDPFADPEVERKPGEGSSNIF